MGSVNDYSWELVDDGTLDTVIRVTLIRDSEIGKNGEIHIVRFDSEFMRLEDGSIDEDFLIDELELWADQLAESRV